jgi:RNA polymerase sigma-54 factor
MVGMELRQQLKLTQQLVMTPQLQQAIKLLQLSRMELVDMVRQEMTENPVLEDSIDAPEPTFEGGASTADGALAGGDGAAHEREAMLQQLERQEQRESHSDTEVKGAEQVDWEQYLENHANQPPMPSYRPETEELPNIEATLSKQVSLFDHLLWQVRMGMFTDEEERFALLVIGNLDKHGYLIDEVTIEELAVEAGLNPEDAEDVLLMIQEFDPVGVAARNLRECLLAQVRVFELDEDVEAIVDRHLANLEKRNYQAIARDLKLPLEEIYAAAKIISSLEPRPGRNFTGEDTNYITPDVYVYKLADKYFVVPNDDGMPKLKISGYYRSAMSGDPKAREYIQGKLRSAQWLIRSIDQRRRTIVKVTECIVEKQQEFFDKGIAYLKPMILRDVAESVGMHESTISRVTTSKYVHTPQGIFELKYFFNSSIRRLADDDIASESVKQAIKVIIEGEDKRKPLSDQKIVKMLEKKGIVIARRTVAKYREMLGILSSSKRRQVY